MASSLDSIRLLLVRSRGYFQGVYRLRGFLAGLGLATLTAGSAVSLG